MPLLPMRPLLLLVDDEPDILETVQELIGSSIPDVRVVTAGNGLDALQKLRTMEVDAVLTDYRMPGMDGVALLHEVAKQWPAMPTLMFTAYVDQATLKDLHQRLPTISILPKPIEVASFLDRLQKLVEPVRSRKAP